MYPHRCIFSGIFNNTLNSIIIGSKNTIPWLTIPLFKNDLKFFAEKTTGHIIIMGRKTMESLPYFPLKNRINIVVSKNSDIYNSVPSCARERGFLTEFSLTSALKKAYSIKDSHQEVYVIGGRSLIQESLIRGDCLGFYYTKIRTKYNYSSDDTELNNITFDNSELMYYHNKTWKGYLIKEDSDTENNKYEVYDFRPYNKSEEEYLNLLRECKRSEDIIQSRAGNTRRVLVKQLHFNLDHGFPLLTTKKMFYKGIWTELCWFLLGYTDNRILKEKGVHIWNGNSSRQFLDSIGMTERNEDCCGPIYGYQWRNFNYPYDEKKETSEELGRKTKDVSLHQDQFLNCLVQMIHEPNSRRMIMSGWNPAQIDEMCLPPCHLLYQFFVIQEKETNNRRIYLSMYQRSADLFLGVPFNIASCAFLMYICSYITGYSLGSLTITLGDAHIYEDHNKESIIDKQLNNLPHHFPILKQNKEWNTFEELLENTKNFIMNKNYKEANIKLCEALEYGLTILPEFENYIHGPVIKAPMNV